jgi:hypothetical protein
VTYFVIEHDRRTGENIISEFTDSAIATRVLNQKERDRLSHVEVVMLAAENLNHIKQTHSRYFYTVEEIMASVRDSILAPAS